MGGKPQDPEIVNYPAWKKFLWRFGRGLITGALGSVTLQSLLMNADLTNPQTYFRALVAAVITGALLGIGKFLREEFGEDHPLIHKIPV